MQIQNYIYAFLSFSWLLYVIFQYNLVRAIFNTNKNYLEKSFLKKVSNIFIHTVSLPMGFRPSKRIILCLLFLISFFSLLLNCQVLYNLDLSNEIIKKTIDILIIFPFLYLFYLKFNFLLRIYNLLFKVLPYIMKNINNNKKENILAIGFLYLVIVVFLTFITYNIIIRTSLTLLSYFDYTIYSKIEIFNNLIIFVVSLFYINRNWYENFSFKKIEIPFFILYLYIPTYLLIFLIVQIVGINVKMIEPLKLMASENSEESDITQRSNSQINNTSNQVTVSNESGYSSDSSQITITPNNFKSASIYSFNKDKLYSDTVNRIMNFNTRSFWDQYIDILNKYESNSSKLMKLTTLLKYEAIKQDSHNSFLYDHLFSNDMTLLFEKVIYMNGNYSIYLPSLEDYYEFEQS